MTLSVHDNLLVSYEVQREPPSILLRTVYRVENKPTEFRNVMFKDVQGYRFENDAFENIICGVDPMPLEQFLAEHGHRTVGVLQDGGRSWDVGARL